MLLAGRPLGDAEFEEQLAAILDEAGYKSDLTLEQMNLMSSHVEDAVLPQACSSEVAPSMEAHELQGEGELIVDMECTDDPEQAIPSQAPVQELRRSPRGSPKAAAAALSVAATAKAKKLAAAAEKRKATAAAAKKNDVSQKPARKTVAKGKSSTESDRTTSPTKLTGFDDIRNFMKPAV